MRCFKAKGQLFAEGVSYLPSKPAREQFDTDGTKETPDSIHGDDEGPDHGDRLWRRRLFISVVPAAVDEALNVLQVWKQMLHVELEHFKLLIIFTFKHTVTGRKHLV